MPSRSTLKRTPAYRTESVLPEIDSRTMAELAGTLKGRRFSVSKFGPEFRLVFSPQRGQYPTPLLHVERNFRQSLVIAPKAEC